MVFLEGFIDLNFFCNPINCHKAPTPQPPNAPVTFTNVKINTQN